MTRRDEIWLIAVLLGILAASVFVALKWPSSFTHSLLASVIGVILAFGIAYVFLERYRLQRERQRQQIKKETLRIFKNALVPWMYHYASCLSGRFQTVDGMQKLLSEEYKTDWAELEDIFGVELYDRNGNKITGTKDGPSKDITEYPIDPHFVRSSLDYGIREYNAWIHPRLNSFPTILEDASSIVIPIVGLGNRLRWTLANLDQWKEQSDRGTLKINWVGKHNLRQVGQLTLKILDGVDNELKGKTRQRFSKKWYHRFVPKGFRRG